MGSASSIVTSRSEHTEVSSSSSSPLVSPETSDGFDILCQVPEARVAFARFILNASWVKDHHQFTNITNTFHRADGNNELSVTLDRTARTVHSYMLPSSILSPRPHITVPQQVSEEVDNNGGDDTDNEDNLEINVMERTKSKLVVGVDGKLQKRLRTDSAQSPCSSNGNSSSTRSDKNVLTGYLFHEHDMKSVAFVALFPLFVRSKEFGDWMSKRPVQLLPNNSLTLLSQSKLQSENMSPMDRLKISIARVFVNMSEESILQSLEAGEWMEDFSRAVDKLPIAVTIAEGVSERPGYHLTYCNEKFMDLTGYSREEILGRNCKFLQNRSTEPEQIQKLTDSLKHHKPLKIALTNTRKDGNEFTNLLALHPVFDESRDDIECNYVVGVQLDLACLSKNKDELRFVDDIIFLLQHTLHS